MPAELGTVRRFRAEMAAGGHSAPQEAPSYPPIGRGITGYSRSYVSCQLPEGGKAPTSAPNFGRIMLYSTLLRRSARSARRWVVCKFPVRTSTTGWAHRAASVRGPPCFLKTGLMSGVIWASGGRAAPCGQFRGLLHGQPPPLPPHLPPARALPGHSTPPHAARRSPFNRGTTGDPRPYVSC